MSMSLSEVASRDAIQTQQLERLRSMLAELLGRNPFWTRKLGDAGITPDAISSLDDLRKCPFTTKQELVADQLQHPPYGTNLTYPLSAYLRLHQTSGTTGRPMRWLDTRASWQWFMDCWEEIYRQVGLRADDVLAFPFSFGPFIGFWAAFDGACRLGNRCLALGGMTSEARLKLIDELQATFVCCTPTYALRLAEVAAEIDLDLAAGPVRGLLVAGEPGANVPAVRQRLEAAWGARVFDHWGMTDIGSLAIEPAAAPGGLQLLETQCIAEIIDPQTTEPAPPGTAGELVITNLGRWGQPVVRYRTGDLVQAATADAGPLRLEGGILGRTDEMVTIRGNNVFPSSIEAILREFAGVAEFRITLETRRSMPHLKVEVEPQPDVLEQPGGATDLLHAVARAIKDRLNFQAEIASVPVGALPRFELKGRRFVRSS